jgi:hypothetical protein
MLKKLLVASVLLAVPFATGCSDPCGDLADEVEACCADLDAATQSICQAIADGYRESGEDDACQQVLDAGVNCGA